jgi:dipeptidyl aminopeptidase/acylaminoacyl peptidase
MLMKKISLLVVWVMLSCFSQAQPTLENSLSAPFPSALTSSSDHRRIAWIMNEKGVRNVYVADAPGFVPRRLTNNSEDDGVDISSLSFSPDGNTIFFTWGNSVNAEGEPANPAFLQTSTAKSVWMVHADGTSLRKIGNGDKASCSPDGHILVFISGGKIWWADLMDSAKKPTILFQARGVPSDLRWSPKGDRVAFISNRENHALLGIYNPATKSLNYPDPSVDTDSQPCWSPDGHWIAFIRIPFTKQLPWGPLRAGNPWSIRLINIEKGTSQELWKAHPGDGSILFPDALVSANLLLWAAGNRLIFPWEGDGFQHLYQLDIFRGGGAKLLTPGEGEVENYLLSADGHAVIYNSNIGDRLRRHLWSVSLNDGKPILVSPGDGIEWSPVFTTAGLVTLRATAKFPGRLFLLKNASIEAICGELFAPYLPGSEFIQPKAVSLTAADGLALEGQLFLPPGYQPGKKYPALLYLHGGSERQMLLGFHWLPYYSNIYVLNQYYAARGFIVLSLNYRSGIGYGMRFRESPGYGAHGAGEYQDVIAGGRYLQNRGDVDVKKIGIWGSSYGGYLTAMALGRNSDIFACGVDMYGITDWTEEVINMKGEYDDSTWRVFAQKATASSPVSFAKSWRSPVLFIHADDDRNVSFKQTIMMIEKLRRQHVEIEQLVVPDEVHDALLFTNFLKEFETAASFFMKRLK